MLLVIETNAQESQEREIFNKFVSLFKNKDFQNARKLIHPDFRDYVENVDTALYSYLGATDRIEDIKLERFDSNSVEITLTAYRDTNSLYRNFFLVKEGNNYYFTNPLSVLTKNWNRIESENFFFVFDSTKTNRKYGINYPTPLSINIMDEGLRWYLNVLDIKKLKGKITIYMASSPEEVGKLVGNKNNFEGLTRPRDGDYCIAIFPHAVLHELGHILLYKKTGKSILSSFLTHGLEEYGDGDGGKYKSHLSNYWMKQKIESGDTLSLKDAKEYKGITSFTKFLIEELGRVKFRELLGEISNNNDADLAPLVEKVYQTKIKNIEDSWISWLKNYHISDKQIIRDSYVFRIITDTFSKNMVGNFTTIYCDAKRKLPSTEQINKFEENFLNQKDVKSYKQVELYLLNNKNRMQELFGVRDTTFFAFENIIAITTKIDSIKWNKN